MSLHHISIVLEVVSFFFVTTDLYGSKRLRRIQDGLTSIKSAYKDERIEKYTFLFTMTLYILSSLCGVLYIAFVLDIGLFAKFFGQYLPPFILPFTAASITAGGILMVLFMLVLRTFLQIIILVFKALLSFG